MSTDCWRMTFYVFVAFAIATKCTVIVVDYCLTHSRASPRHRTRDKKIFCRCHKVTMANSRIVFAHILASNLFRWSFANCRLSPLTFGATEQKCAKYRYGHCVAADSKQSTNKIMINSSWANSSSFERAKGWQVNTRATTWTRQMNREREGEKRCVCNLHEFYYRIVYCRRVFCFVHSVFSVRVTCTRHRPSRSCGRIQFILSWTSVHKVQIYFSESHLYALHCYRVYDFVLFFFWSSFEREYMRKIRATMWMSVKRSVTQVRITKHTKCHHMWNDFSNVINHFMLRKWFYEIEHLTSVHQQLHSQHRNCP